MNICIAHITTLLIIAGMLFAGCDTTPQATDEPPREEHLPPSVKVPKGIEKPDPSEKPDLLDTSVAFPALSTFRKIFGAPHILEDGVCYYMGTAKTDGTLMMLLFIEDTIIASQTLTYKQDVLYTYIPLLIESLQNEDKAVAKQALKFLTDVRRQRISPLKSFRPCGTRILINTGKNGGIQQEKRITNAPHKKKGVDK